ncbi:MAG TPA: aminopeptidase P family protein [Fredinandcohnia sp.]|nr:aminopeptidase P family protein [Fredinandcohnia sp.]
MTKIAKKKSAARAPARASHDTAPPDAFRAFMLSKWKPQKTRKIPLVKGAKNFHARRRALSERFPGEVLVIPTGHEKVRANDTFYRFRPGSDFYYLTGNVEPDCVLVLEPRGKKGHRDVLFVEPNPGRSDETFFLDRNKGELWVGPRMGVPESLAHFGVDDCRGLDELEGYLSKIKGPVRVLRGFSEAVEKAVKSNRRKDEELATVLSEMRLIKDDLEIRELQKAIDSTKRGFEDIIARLKVAKTEREIEGVFFLRARTEGNDVGYGTIAASGANACILHWTRNDAPVKPGDLVLIDAGVEADTLYTADVTRVLPVSGTFSPEQREVYELVLAANLAAIAEVKPGNDFLDPHRAAMRVLAKGLERMGILKDAEEALREENQFYRRYTLHNTSHMLGLDVHDCAKARAETYLDGVLAEGNVLTVEPGLYLQPDDLTLPPELRGIGVRIEDDLVITADGARLMSAGLPRHPDEVENWMATLLAG